MPEYRRDPDGAWIASHPAHTRNPTSFWVRDASGELLVLEDEIDGYRVRRYRPRVEGLFARIERWSKIGAAADVHWRSITRDNLLTIYGSDANSRIADPQDENHIFAWLICQTRDGQGNAVLYVYKPEDGRGVTIANANERNRGPLNDPQRTANRYIKHIHYGDRTTLLDATGQRPRFLAPAQLAAANWMFEVVFDYGEHADAAPTPDDGGTWTYRSDAFSFYRSCFEVRTTRLCQARADVPSFSRCRRS